MSDLDPGTVVAALAVDVPLTPPPAAQIIAGAPQTGSLDLDDGETLAALHLALLARG